MWFLFFIVLALLIAYMSGNGEDAVGCLGAIFMIAFNLVLAAIPIVIALLIIGWLFG